MPRILGSLLTILLWCTAASAQQAVVISEPALVTLPDLFKQADAVAVVQILSGDSENYATAVYKSKVVEMFKGPVRASLFFGPFIGYRIGSEHVAFFRRAKTAPKLQSRAASSLAYGPLAVFHLIMYEGYSIMPIEYVCAFEGKEIAQQCDYGVKVNTVHVELPSGTQTFPRASSDGSEDANKWVRKDDFIRLLVSLR
jgi:hypothetical protein